MVRTKKEKRQLPAMHLPNVHGVLVGALPPLLRVKPVAFAHGLLASPARSSLSSSPLRPGGASCHLPTAGVAASASVAGSRAEGRKRRCGGEGGLGRRLGSSDGAAATVGDE